MRQRVILLLILLTARPARADDFAGAEARLLADLKFLTSGDCEGRGIDTKGMQLAAEYIERQMINAGLKPAAGGSYFQPFTVARSAKLGAENRLSLRGPLGQTIRLEQDKNFTILPIGGSGKAEAPIVFAGYGLTSTDPPYDDYAGLDVKGKIVLVLTDAPRRGHPQLDDLAHTSAWGQRSPLSIRSKIDNARKRQAAGLLLVNSRRQTRLQDPIPRPAVSPVDAAPLGLPAAHIPRDLAEAMLFSVAGQTLAQVEQQIDADLKPRSRPLAGWSARLEADVAFQQVAVKNVVGLLEGYGPRAHETIVLGAHYDHVGFFGTTRKFGGKTSAVSGPSGIGGVGFPLALSMENAVHHGADDNASGTVVLLELARHFGGMKQRQGRRLIFIAFTAEESGLVGADHYCRAPLFPLQDTAAMLNMDMVGRLQDDKLKVGGLGTAKTFPPLIDILNQKHKFHLDKELSGLGGSDHAVFYASGIPIFNFFTGFHEQYHRPTDRWQTVNVAGMKRVAALVADVTAELMSVSRPEYTKAPPYDRTRSLWANAPCTGLVPDYADTATGVLIETILKETPAAKSGFQKGDRIVVLAGKPVSSATEFLALTRALEPGTSVATVVERAGQKQTINLQLAKRPLGPQDPHFGFVADLKDVRNGLVLLDVPAETPAAKAGLKKGDRVRAIGGAPIDDLSALAAAMTSVRPGETVALSVERDGQVLTLQATTAADGKKKR